MGSFLFGTRTRSVLEISSCALGENDGSLPGVMSEVVHAWDH